MNNSRFVASYYYPAKEELPQPVVEDEAPVAVEEPVAVVEEDEGLLTAIEPEPVREPVYSSYFDEDVLPPVYRLQYTMSAPSVGVAPVPVAAQPVVAAEPAVEQLPVDYFLRPAASAPEASIEAPAPPVATVKVEQIPADHFLNEEAKKEAVKKTFSRTYNAYNQGEPCSDYAWAHDQEDQQQEDSVKEYSLVPNIQYEARHVPQEESMYIGFQNDVVAAYNRPTVPISYSMTSVKVAQPAPVVKAPVEAAQAAASLECLTAVEGPVKFSAPAPPRSRFMSQVKPSSIPMPQKAPSMDYAAVEGDAFRPVVMPQSEYQYEHLNDLVSCIDIKH